MSLSSNLFGRWERPDGSYVDQDSITIPTLYISHAGLYKFYVANWDGDWTLAIQIEISTVGKYRIYNKYLKQSLNIILLGSAFGKQIDQNTFASLSEDSILISNATLYCLTSSRNATEVLWSYEDASGNREVLSGTTDASTGISTLSVNTHTPGYYSCEVSLEGGMNKAYTVEMMDISQYTGM